MFTQSTSSSAPQIHFKFQGLVALCVAESKREFDAAIIKGSGDPGDVPEHSYAIEIIKRKEGIEVHDKPFPLVFDKDNPAKFLRLELAPERTPAAVGISPRGIMFPEPKQVTPLITAFSENGSPVQPNKVIQHFSKILDVEEVMFNGSKAEVNPDALRTVLNVRGVAEAEFLSTSDSNVSLEFIDNSGDQRAISNLAAEAIASFLLPEEGADLFICQGRADLDGALACSLDFQGDVSYEIIVRNDCTPGACQKGVTKFYNLLIGKGKRKRKGKAEFLSRPPRQKTSIDPPLDLRGEVATTTSSGTACDAVNFSKTSAFPDPL